MTSEDTHKIIQAIKEEIVRTFDAMKPEMEKAVEAKIETTVNGKINALRVILDDHVEQANEHREKVNEFITAMRPARKAIWTLTALREFAVWISGFGIIGTIVYLGIKEFLVGK